MKIKTKETILSDGSKVYDVNIFPNGGSLIDRKVIISCISQEASDKFLLGLDALFKEYTVEVID